MMDIWCEEQRLIVDPKSTALLTDAEVGRHMYNMGWDRQAALYPHAVGMIKPELAGHVRFVDLMVKPKAPFTARFVGLEKAEEYLAIQECRIAFERFGACMKAGEWPDYGDTVYRATLPAWASKAREALIEAN